MPSKPGVELISGSTEIVTAQKPLQLSTTEKVGLLGVWVGPDSGNTGKAIAIGGSKESTEAKPKSEKGLVIYEKGAPVFIEVNDLSKVWGDVETSKDKIVWTAVVA